MSVFKYHAFIFLDQPPPWLSRTSTTLVRLTSPLSLRPVRHVSLVSVTPVMHASTVPLTLARHSSLVSLALLKQSKIWSVLLSDYVATSEAFLNGIYATTEAPLKTSSRNTVLINIHTTVRKIFKLDSKFSTVYQCVQGCPLWGKSRETRLCSSFLKMRKERRHFDVKPSSNRSERKMEFFFLSKKHILQLFLNDNLHVLVWTRSDER
jgi:hypothetical protein